MNEHDFHELERRSAFWRNSDFELGQTLKHFEKHLADKWVSEKDSIYIEGILYHLKQCFSLCKGRYVAVLNAQIDSFSGVVGDETVDRV